MSKTVHKSEGLWLSQGDAFEWLRKIPDGEVDLVLTDFPYASLEKHRATGTTTRLSKSKASSNEWFGVIPNSRLPELCAEYYRVLKPATHCYLFCDDETSDPLRKAAVDAGFYCWKRLVWNKQAMGMGYHYRAQYEFILFLEKGKSKWIPEEGKVFHGTRQLKNRGVADVLSATRIKSADAYPTEKPLSILETLVLNSTEEGELVVDPFMGSGVAGEAAISNNRYFWGCDLSPTSIAHTKRRLRLGHDS